MILETRAVQPFYKNGFVVGCEETREAVIIDPGDEVDDLLAAVSRHGLSVKAILLTHAHLDHVTGVGKAKAALAVPVWLHRDDNFLYEAVVQQGQMFGLRVEAQPPIDHFYDGEGPFLFGRYRVRILHTPGHCPGGVCLAVTRDGGEMSAASDPRERRGDHGVPASARVGGSGGAKPPGEVTSAASDPRERGGDHGVPASERAEWSGPNLAAQWSEPAGVQGSPAIKKRVGGSGGEKPPGKENATLFVGDTLFAGSIGRTDLPGGDMDTLLRSIREVLFKFPDDTLVWSGHGGQTTIGRERRSNPFLT